MPVLKYNVSNGGASYTEEYHRAFAGSPWVVVKRVPVAATEGDIAVVFSQFGEVVDVRFLRHGKSGAFLGRAFVRFADCRSCVLATDNMNSSRVDLVKRERPNLLQNIPDEVLRTVRLLPGDEPPLQTDHCLSRDVPQLPHEALETYGEWYERDVVAPSRLDARGR